MRVDFPAPLSANGSVPFVLLDEMHPDHVPLMRDYFANKKGRPAVEFQNEIGEWCVLHTDYLMFYDHMKDLYKEFIGSVKP